MKLLGALKALAVSLCYAEFRMQVKLGMKSDSNPYRSACCTVHCDARIMRTYPPR